MTVVMFVIIAIYIAIVICRICHYRNSQPIAINPVAPPVADDNVLEVRVPLIVATLGLVATVANEHPRIIPAPIAEEQHVGATALVNIRCGICSFEAVNLIYVPCGHTFCSECVVRLLHNYPLPQRRAPFQTTIVFSYSLNRLKKKSFYNAKI